ncbi:MAG TPA: selenide, water dikinase SelD, partial [Actinomycetota bacterium]
GTALVQSVDFFTPIVDDPYDWGRIAAANALSDLYAMGARPVLALNLVAWPVEELSLDLLADVLRGGAKVASEAGVAVVGGHSITDPEPKYGMAVTGFADQAHLTRNSTARPGAALWLTKPLGIGIVTTAIKRRKASPEQVAAAVEVMTTLNAAAAEAARDVGAQAVTDVTGFGFLGHLHEMLRASGVAAVVDAGAVPTLTGTLALAGQGVVPSGSRRNHDFLSPHVTWGDLPEAEQMVLADAQTSGGLLIAVSEESGGALGRELEARGIAASRVGTTLEGTPGAIEVRGRVGGI